MLYHKIWHKDVAAVAESAYSFLCKSTVFKAKTCCEKKKERKLFQSSSTGSFHARSAVTSRGGSRLQTWRKRAVAVIYTLGELCSWDGAGSRVPAAGSGSDSLPLHQQSLQHHGVRKATGAFSPLPTRTVRFPLRLRPRRGPQHTAQVTFIVVVSQQAVTEARGEG